MRSLHFVAFLTALISTHCVSDFTRAVRSGVLEYVRPFFHIPYFDAASLMNVLDEKEQAPLYVAMDLGHVNVALELIRKRPDFSLQSKNNFGQKESYLHLAIRNDILVPCLEEMLALGANPNAMDEVGRTVLHCATALGGRSAEIIRTLITKGGANPEIPNGYGYTAIHAAIETRDPTPVVALLNCGADVRAKDTFQRNALHHSLIYDNLEMTKAIVEIGMADIEETDMFGSPPVTAAFNRGSFEISKYLIERDPLLGALHLATLVWGASPTSTEEKKRRQEETRLGLTMAAVMEIISDRKEEIIRKRANGEMLPMDIRELRDGRRGSEEMESSDPRDMQS